MPLTIILLEKTNTRDEDTEMQRYIEEQLTKLQQKSSTTTTASNLSANDELSSCFCHIKKTRRYSFSC